ncbi:MAG: phosphatidylglycerophosphatase A [Proteobacteria bacterium]|nr:phosphatidylglycerophosphatase A [Pseudomonadota bacterium]
MNEPESTHVSFLPFTGIFNFVQNLALLVTTFFMVGLLPKAPGTWASLAAVFAYGLFAEMIWQHQAQIIIITMLLGVWCLHIVQKKIGPRDDGRFVIDEVVGMWIGVATFPFEWQWMLVGFLIFRALDIWKPFPTRHIDRRMHGAWGVMLDDVICGLDTLAIMRVILSLRVFL